MKNSLTPTQFCEQQTRHYIDTSLPELRKNKGQFFTPTNIALFMACLAKSSKTSLRILDAGAGTGMLSCAICEAIANVKTVKDIEIVAYEDHPPLTTILKESYEHAKKWLKNHGINLTYKTIEQDFILCTAQNLFTKRPEPFDIAIGNPPYFKINKNDPRARETTKYIYGQPNIYALFMGVAAELLKKNGLMVYITPRSFAAGPYFKLFRKNYFEMMNLERVHIFESRTDAFKSQEVLQENIILKARKTKKTDNLTISVSNGLRDLRHSKKFRLPLSFVMHKTNIDTVIRLPSCKEDMKIIELVETWKGNLHKYGWEISTGPVVPFRATHLIHNEKESQVKSVPLLWMQNVQLMNVVWPRFDINNGKNKPQFIIENEESTKRRLLVNDQNTILLRRFSAKEDKRRLIAAPLFESALGSNLIGIENHINYVYSKYGHINKFQTLGLCALLNSSLLDKYFRVSNGNTQVSATEIRSIPLPSQDQIENIGEEISKSDHLFSHDEVDNLIYKKLAKGLAREQNH
jgi:adenine-specific DNA-methyltransferase